APRKSGLRETAIAAAVCFSDRLGGPSQPPRESGSLDTIEEALSATPLAPPSGADPADFFHGPLGAAAVGADKEDNGANEPEGVTEHESLHLAVVGAAPVGPGQERPADLDLPLPFVVAVEARGADDAAVLAVDGDQRATGFQSFAEKGLEDL